MRVIDIAAFVMLAACGNDGSRASAKETCARQVAELRDFAQQLSQVAETGVTIFAEGLPEIRSGGRVERRPVDLYVHFDVTLNGRLIATTAEWHSGKAAAVEAALVEAQQRMQAEDPTNATLSVRVWAHRSVEWEVMAALIVAIARAKLTPIILFRAPLGVRDPKPSAVPELVDRAARSGYDSMAAMLKYYREEPGNPDELPHPEIHREFRKLWASCPMPSSPPVGIGFEPLGGAWHEYLTQTVPNTVAACNCKADLPLAEGFVWALFGGHRYRLVTRMVQVAQRGQGARIALPKNAPWADAAGKLAAGSVEQPVELVVE